MELGFVYFLFVFAYLAVATAVGMLLDVAISQKWDWAAVLVTLFFLPADSVIGGAVLELTGLVFAVNIVVGWPVIVVVTAVIFFVSYLIVSRL